MWVKKARLMCPLFVFFMSKEFDARIKNASLGGGLCCWFSQMM